MLNPTEISDLIQNGHVAEARKRCRDEVAQGRADARTWLLLGACEQRMDAPKAAVEALQKAAEATNDAGLLQQVADTMIKLRAFEPAAAVIARLDFSRPETVLMQARCRWGLGEHAAALEQARALWNIVPQWNLLTVSFARMLINMAMHAEAMRVVDKALAIKPGEPELVHQKALLLVSGEGADAALSWIGNQPRSHTAVRMLADALAAVADRHQAMPTHVGPNWEGFVHMLETGGDVPWYGDNVAMLRHALQRAPEQGAIVECGVYHGRTVSLLAQWAPERRVFGFDSFEGLPEAWSGLEPAGSYSTGGRLPEVPENVELVAGWFDRTLPDFAAGLDEPIALLHVDCDLYKSTADVLAALGPRLASGSIVVFDEYTGFAGWREHEHKAWREYLEQSGTGARLCAAQLLGQSAVFEVTGVRA